MVWAYAQHALNLSLIPGATYFPEHCQLHPWGPLSTISCGQHCSVLTISLQAYVPLVGPFDQESLVRLFDLLSNMWGTPPL